METRRIVLVSETQFVPFGELGKVSSAVQKQVNDHFGPIWGVHAAMIRLPPSPTFPLTPGWS